MNLLIEEFSLGLPDLRELARVTLRLLAASLLGAIIGAQREQAGKPAGLRTHMLVCLGAALFVVVPAQAGMDSDDLSRIIQGLATGIGFLGGGAILKLNAERDIQGLTTAAGIWLTAAVGIAAGLGALGIAFLSVPLAWLILAVLWRIERRIGHGHTARSGPAPEGDNAEKPKRGP